MPAPKPVVLCILDGWGIGPNPDTSAPAQAHVPTFNHLWATCPHATLTTFGPDVGLPTGQMGNSEVGHTNIGAGRVVAMDLGAIDLAVEDGSFAKNPAILDFAAKVKAKGGTAHLMGVVSDGGVHGHVNHILAACRAITALGVPVALHAITDGRDVAPSSAQGFVEALVKRLPYGAGIATVTGRYWAMDRDNRWERVTRAYEAMIHAKGETAPDPLTAISNSYGKGATDEFLAPTVIDGYHGAKDGDGVFCLNFRADRAREILAAIGDRGFTAFDTGVRPKWSVLLGMVEYSDLHNAYIGTAFPKRVLVNTIGEWVASHGLTQFRLAETEKYPHVTFFLNGGREAPYPGEDRAMPPSPKVATYDLQPEMSADQVSDHFVAAIEKGYDLIVVNFANPDMVGHTGSLPAAIKACEAVDRGLTRALAALQARGGAMIVTADHGNCEVMVDPVTGGPHTAHTTNPVPVILVGGPAGATLRSGGRLADLAPTLLQLMGLPQPAENDWADPDRMIRAAALFCLLALPLQAETVAEQAAKASADLQQAVAELEAATEARDRVSALSQTIRAYEAGLAALRSALREAALREATLTRAFDAKRDGIGRLLGVLATMEANPGPLLLLHPEGAVGSARSGMILADVTPALQAEAQVLKGELQELADLRDLQLSAGKVLETGLATAQAARTELSKAISDRTDLPKRYTEDPEVLKGLLDSADTLDAFAAGLSPDAEAGTSFASEKGRLPLPALGTILRLPDEADAAGVRRPGIALATQPRALVTAPWPATIRYRGPLLDYGNVMILEPGDGYLLVLAGMETLYGEEGEVVAAEAPLGLMGGPETASAEFLSGSPDRSGGRDTETLYMELRQGAVPVDPIPWFAGLARTGD